MNMAKKPTTRKPAKGPASKLSGGGVLNERYRRFVDAYLISGNATDAARKAGYTPVSASETGSRLLRNPQIMDLIAKAQAKASKPAIASREERLEILTALARGDDGAKPNDRIAAANLISKMHGELIQKTQLTGADGGPVSMEISSLAIQDLITLLREAK